MSDREFQALLLWLILYELNDHWIVKIGLFSQTVVVVLMAAGVLLDWWLEKKRDR